MCGKVLCFMNGSVLNINIYTYNYDNYSRVFDIANQLLPRHSPYLVL